MKNIILFILSVVFFTGCASTTFIPPGKLKDTDLLSKKISLNTPVAKTLREFHQSLRYCGLSRLSRWETDTSTLYGVNPQCIPPDENGAVLCDIPVGFDRIIIGIIELTPDNNKTNAAIYVRKDVINPENTLAAWEQFLQGKYKEVCPD